MEVPVQGVRHVLHDDVGGAVFDLEVMDAGDVGAVKTSGQPGFALEGVQVLRVVRNGLIDDLNGDDTVQHGVAGTVERGLPPVAIRSINSYLPIRCSMVGYREYRMLGPT